MKTELSFRNIGLLLLLVFSTKAQLISITGTCNGEEIVLLTVSGVAGSSGTVTLEEAEEECQDEDSSRSLASVHDLEELDELIFQIARLSLFTKNYWLGIQHEGTVGQSVDTFIFTDGTDDEDALEFIRQQANDDPWADGHPEDDDLHCVVLTEDGFTEVDCDSEQGGYICRTECIEEDPTISPTTSPSTSEPTSNPTTSKPTLNPTTLTPSSSPTTLEPTNSPTIFPTTFNPTSGENDSPTFSPSVISESTTGSPTTTDSVQNDIEVISLFQGIILTSMCFILLVMLIFSVSLMRKQLRLKNLERIRDTIKFANIY